jgi:hypothetical protein
MSAPFRPALAVLGLLLTGSAPLCAAVDMPLAIVNGDTVATNDLDFELALVQRQAGSAAVPAPKAADVLRRLTQNRLIVQEGYRMSLQEQFTVKNQVTEAVRSQCTKVLLDSVVASVPATVKDVDDARRAAVKNYIDDLKRRYAGTVNTKLLQSLDYASADEAVQQKLHDSEEVIAVIPPGPMTVKGLSRQIRFTEFHGMKGKPDAGARRDRIFEEWLVESLLRYQAKIQRVAQRPAMVRLKGRLERELMYEETLKVLADVKYAPTEAQVEAYYRKHLGEVTPEPRVRLESAKAKTLAAAKKLGDQLRQGVKLSWLARTSADLVAGPAPLPAMWIEPEMLKLSPADAVVGHVMEPAELPGGWLVAVIVEREPAQPQPLAECRDEMIGGMRAEYTHTQMTKMLAKLEKAAKVRILPGAEAEVSRRIEQSRRDSVGNARP